MANIIGPPANVIRNKPIAKKLDRLLLRAADAAAIETVQVTSGGQPGTHGRRTGSTRHDNGNAADLKLLKGGRALNFTLSNDRPTVETFVTAAAAHGATGIGAGVDYMGPLTLHVGFGSRAIWGAGGRAVNAPGWLKAAAEKGLANPAGTPHEDQADRGLGREVAGAASGQFVVIARGGLRLRGGAGVEFGIIMTLEAGRQITVLALEGANNAWARVDLEGDGLVDGYVSASFLAPADGNDEVPGADGDDGNDSDGGEA
jgi:uncharacterized protein YgiM (DUF1202 family)